MKPLTVVFFSNVLDERTRVERGVTTDSPAATRKVLNACHALRAAGARPIVLSMGRGRADGSSEAHGWTVRRVGRVPVVYAPFLRRRRVSEVVSLLAPALFILRRRRNRRTVLLLYNRVAFGILPLLAARLGGWPAVFDLEDGEILPKTAGAAPQQSAAIEFGRRLLIGIYDRLCGRAILAATALEHFTSVRPTWLYYGSVPTHPYPLRRPDAKIHVLYSGTITPLTGSDNFAEALALLAREQPLAARSLVLHVTGNGDGLAQIQRLAETCPELDLNVYGRISFADYEALLRRARLGLSLKRMEGPYAETTFPSKTVEYAAAGLHVISTDISDVRRVLGEHARFVTSDSPRELAAAIAEAVALGPEGLEARSRALHGHIMRTLSFEETGWNLAQFLEGAFGRDT